MKLNPKKWWQENKSFLLFLVLMFCFRSVIADWNTVLTGSMKPTIQEGDLILVNKMAYDIRLPFTHIALMKLADPECGDIIVFDSKVSDKRLVKRVVGMPGDIVAMINNILIVNGKALPYDNEQAQFQSVDRIEHLFGVDHTVRLNPFGSALSSFNAVKVPEGYYLALGDNRDNSADSRVIGFVPRNEIVGCSRTVVWSLDYDDYYLPRSDRFFYAL